MKKNNFKSLFYNSKLQSIKLNSYFDIYETIFKEFRNKPITFVEVGIFGGGSLLMWKKYFHPQSRIIGIDLNPKSKDYEKYGFEIFIGDQEDENFWKKFYKTVGKVDIVLDDGGHTDPQQIQTLISAINNIKQNGLIVIEDVHTSYFTEFGNPSKNSFVNYSKKIVDLINSRYFSLNKSINNPNKISKLFKKNIYSVTFHESLIAFKISKKKNIVSKPVWNRRHIKKIKDFRYKKNKNNVWQTVIYIKKIIPKFLINSYLLRRFSIGIIKFLINKNKKKKLIKYFF